MAEDQELDSEDEDAAAAGGGEAGAPGEDGPPYACPEPGCEKTFSSKLALGGHRATMHGYRSSTRHKGKSGRGPGRPRKDGSPARPRETGAESKSQERRRKVVRETLIEVATFQDQLAGLETGDPSRLADVIKRDADKIANSVAWIAERFNPLGRGIDLLLGHGGPVTILRGFMGLGRFTLARWQAAARRQQEQGAGVDLAELELAERIEAENARRYLVADGE